MNNTLDYIQSCFDAFNLECSVEDLKENKEARELLKTLRKQRRLAKRIDKLTRKFFSGGNKNEKKKVKPYAKIY